MAKNEQETPKEYKYNRICKLPTCSESFKTNREWQKFCRRVHQTIYWKIYRTSESDIRRELSSLKKEQKEIKEKLGIV